MSDFSAGQVLVRKDGVVQREVAGEMFLVPIRGHLADLQELFVLNEVGRWLWDHIDGVRSVEDLVTGVVGGFDVDEETARRDTEVFAGRLVEAGLADATFPREG
jgi:hypothetical protein